MAQFSIFEGNMNRLNKKMVRIQNKCKQYGFDFTFKEVGEEIKAVKDDLGIPYNARFVLVEVEGSYKVNGWAFVASVEHTEKGNIISGVGSIEVPERFYSTDPICEHCNSKRSRKDTFIIYNETAGEFKQVGKSCLKDYTGGMNAEAVANYTSMFDDLIQGESPMGGKGGERYYETATMLRYYAETVRHFGFISSQESRQSTASSGFEFYQIENGGCFYDREYKEHLIQKMRAIDFNAESEEAIKMVTDATAWLQNQDESNNYFHNLKTACALEYITGRSLGIIASLFAAYNKELVKHEKKIAELESKHIGNIGDRIKIKVESIICVASWETDWGIVTIYKITDDQGNIFTWKTSKCLDLDKVGMITGTVKEHKEFREILQTEVTRCKTERKK